MRVFTYESKKSSIRYWEYHPDAPQTMVLIHGFTGSHEGFLYLIPLLPHIRFIVPDLPGFGQSSLPTRDNWTIDAIARLTNEFVASLNLPTPPHILGHSMGGLVVSSMVHQQPTLYSDDVLLISPVPTPIRRNDARRPGAILGALQYKLGHTTGHVGKRLVNNRTISRALTRLLIKTTDAELRKEIYEHHFKNLDYISDVEFYSKLYTDINRSGAIRYTDALARKRVLVIAGNKDTVAPLAEIKKLVRAINPTEFHVIPNVGHLIHYERAPEAATFISSFLVLR
ncbi:alpha/beta hydrolase [Candidatus Saccharibacteria bacterium]|nr:alpha/beta hydrolase [Candidatus Saccharibacteria bacterium]